MHPQHPQQTAGRVLYRWLAGRALDGRQRTNASWLHPADKVLTLSGRASRWARLPGWRRQMWRHGVTLAGLLAAYGYAVAPLATELTTAGAGAAGAGLAGRRAVRSIRTRRYRRTVIAPLVSALVPVVEMSGPDITARLSVPGPDTPDGAGQIIVPLPDHYAGRAAQLADIARVVSQRMGGEWDAAQQLRRAPFYVHFTPRPAPPGLVTLDMVRDAILSTTQDRPVLGLGARSEVLHLDFTGEIAHLAASIGTGGGKSSFLRLLVAQFAYHGVRDFDVCDVKWVSLQGMEDLPGLRVYRDVEEIWDSIALARAEMDRRYVEMLANPGIEFPRKIIILEEQNSFALETSIRWREVRPQGDKRTTAPVWNDIALLLLKARQVNMNLISVYQRMSAEACGGGTYRDQYGLKLLSRFSPQAWDTLVGTRPRGVSSAVAGRAIAIMGGLHRQVQLPYISPEDAMELGTAGAPVTVPARDANAQVGGPRGRDVTTDQAPAVDRYSLAEAAREPWCPVSYDALRQRAVRGRTAGTWPAPDAAERYTRAQLLDAVGAELGADDQAPALR